MNQKKLVVGLSVFTKIADEILLTNTFNQGCALELITLFLTRQLKELFNFKVINSLHLTR